MKYTMVRFAFALLLGAVLSFPVHAGFGSHGGSYGGGSYGGGGSGGATYGAGYASSGYAAGYGSSGGAGYGSSGGNYVAAYGSSGGASSGGSSGRPGLLSRLHSRVHTHFAAKAARHASYGSSGYVAGGSSGGSSGGYAGYGSSGGTFGGSSGGYHSHYGSVGGGSTGGVSYGSTGSVGYGSTGSVGYGSTGYSSGYGSAGSVATDPVYYGASKAYSGGAAALVANTRAGDDTVKLNVSVPEQAMVYVNDRLTTSTGEVRQFVSRGLESGKSYRFEVRAELNDNGRVVTDTQSVVVTAGGQEHVRFALKAPQSVPKTNAKVDTAVVLNVPENAEVTLAGNETQVKGSTRVFKTSQLKAGEVWDDYVIQVKVGEQVKTQSIRLIAGDKLELSFNFADTDASRLASR